jgi:hypothetical protein
VKVVRTADKLAGKPSSDYIVSLGNTLTTSNSTPNIWDEFTLTLSNVWNNVTSVVFTFSTVISDMADGMTTQTASFVNNAWQTVTTAFKTAGPKNITVAFMDGNNTVSTRSINVTPSAVDLTKKTATITDVKDGTTTVSDNGTTTNTKPTIKGTVSPALGKYYKVNLYDGSTLLAGNMVYNSDRTSWTFTPDMPLSGGLYKLAAKVATFDAGATGSPSRTRTFTILLPLNDTGITSSQCYGADSDTLISCTSPAAINLSNQQDGMVGRDVNNPDNSDGKLGFSYSRVGNYALTECVKDNITGLMWEGNVNNNNRNNNNYVRLVR